MPDRDDAPDPIDKAYVQAEALLHDEAERAARRARVLAAVAGAPETQSAAPSSAVRRSVLRRGGWLAAASVAGLALILATQIDPTAWRRPQTPPAATSNAQAASTAAATGFAASPPPSAAVAPAPTAFAPQVAAPAPTAPIAPPVEAPAAAPPPPPPVPEPQAFPAAPPAPAPAPPPPAAASERSARASTMNDAAGLSGGATDERRDAQDLARSTAKAVPLLARPPSGLESAASPAADQAARLRAAAAAGRTSELEALLGQGVPVDAPDASGETALMRSIQADHPAVAAILRRHGASLERRNHAGESARDMATAKDDADLDQALGLEP